MGFIKHSLCLKLLCSSYSVGKIIKIITFILKKLLESNFDKFWFYAKPSIVLKYSQLYLLFLNEKKKHMDRDSLLFFSLNFSTNKALSLFLYVKSNPFGS